MANQPRQSYGGAGRQASGSLVATWQMHEWLRINGPTDRETVLAECAQFVDEGFARRWYAATINGERLRKVSSGGSRRESKSDFDSLAKPKVEALTVASLSSSDATASAVRALLVRKIKDSVRRKSIARDGDMLTLIRMPRLPKGHTEAMLTLDPVAQYRPIAEMELMRQLRAANARGVFTPAGSAGKSLNASEREALDNWLKTWDDVDDFSDMNKVKYEAVKVLLAMRERQTGQRQPKIRDSERAHLEALWREIDRYA